jgi:hypothetical protein
MEWNYLSYQPQAIGLFNTYTMMVSDYILTGIEDRPNGQPQANIAQEPCLLMQDLIHLKCGILKEQGCLGKTIV